MLELAVLAKDEEGACSPLADALAAIREQWEPGTTARNLRLIREARERRGEPVAWALEVERALQPLRVRMAGMSPDPRRGRGAPHPGSEVYGQEKPPAARLPAPVPARAG